MDIRCVINAIEAFAPRALQESYDNSGLQAGDVTKDCKGVLLTLDVSEQTVEEAASLGCNLIISHHPLLFKGIKTLTPASSTGRILISAVKNDIAIYSAHTNLDNARRGVSARMAAKLGMTDVEVLQPQRSTLLKLVVFAPSTHSEAVKQAMTEAGAGRIGDYDSCTYTMEGTGSFRALSGARPFVGQEGSIHHEPETRIEAILHRSLLGKVTAAMLKAHPYEEPAYDIIPLENADRYAGSGAVGNIGETTAGEFLENLKSVFGCPAVRYCGELNRRISRVALCGGSGAFLIGDALAAGADIYVTGDLKYHDFTENAGKIMLADIGHFESENCTKEIFHDILSAEFPSLRIELAKETNTIKLI